MQNNSLLFFNQNEIKQEYENKDNEKMIILNDLENIILNSDSILEGNSFYTHQTLNLYPELYYKQLNIFWCGKQAQSRICEIGFNAGHSTMLMLLGRESTPLEFTIFDIGHHKYTTPCLDYIKHKFPNVYFEYIEGNSIETIPKWISDTKNNEKKKSYDLVHVDGGHSIECIENDMKNADILLANNGILIVDDTNMNHINNCVNKYLATGRYIELNIIKTVGYPHRIIMKNINEQ